MAGITFYWVSWFFWVIAVFFMKRGKNRRTVLSAGILLIIIVSPHTISALGYEVTFAVIVIICFICSYVSRLETLKAIYFFLCSLIITLSYVCFRIFELVDPIWLTFPSDWMLAVLLVFLSINLQKGKLTRIYIVLMGLIQGDILYAFILNKHAFPYVIGSLAFLDVMALSTALLAVWNAIEFLSAFYEKQSNQLERPKQRMS